MKGIFSKFNVIVVLMIFSIFCLVGCNDDEEDEKQPEIYTIVFMDDEIVLKTEEVEEGKNATAPENPTKEGHTFIGWDKEFINVKADLTVNAQFIINKYTVVFKDLEGNALKTEEVDYNSSATAPEAPIVSGKEFIGWDKEFTNVKENLIINPIYEGIEYTIEFYDGNQKLEMNVSSYEAGIGVELPIYEKQDCEFIGWFLNEISLTSYSAVSSDMTGNLKFYAKYLELTKEPITLPDATYHFTGISKKEHSTQVGVYVYQPVFPSGAATGVTNYDWSTSDASIATVSAYSSITGKSSGYCILTATHKSNGNTINCIIKVGDDGVEFATEEEANTVITYKVTFKNKDGKTIGTQTCFAGGSVIYPVPTMYTGYKFVGWDKPNYNINNNEVITALYEEGVNNYTGKTFGIIGDSISTFSGYVPAHFDVFYPYATGDITNVNMTWWMNVINKMGGTLFANNSWSGSCVGDSSSSATKNDSRLSYSLINGVAPDVILIYIGSNDCASRYVSESQFDSGYKQMLSKLEVLCPETELVICTLPTSPFYTTANLNIYNGIIKKYAAEFELKLIDLQPVDLAGQLIDSAHPKKAGMDLIANKIIEELLK